VVDGEAVEDLGAPRLGGLTVEDEPADLPVHAEHGGVGRTHDPVLGLTDDPDDSFEEPVLPVIAAAEA